MRKANAKAKTKNNFISGGQHDEKGLPGRRFLAKFYNIITEIPVKKILLSNS